MSCHNLFSIPVITSNIIHYRRIVTIKSYICSNIGQSNVYLWFIFFPNIAQQNITHAHVKYDIIPTSVFKVFQSFGLAPIIMSSFGLRFQRLFQLHLYISFHLRLHFYFRPHDSICSFLGKPCIYFYRDAVICVGFSSQSHEIEVKIVFYTFGRVRVCIRCKIFLFGHDLFIGYTELLALIFLFLYNVYTLSHMSRKLFQILE